MATGLETYSLSDLQAGKTFPFVVGSYDRGILIKVSSLNHVLNLEHCSLWIYSRNLIQSAQTAAFLEAVKPSFVHKITRLVFVGYCSSETQETYQRTLSCVPGSFWWWEKEYIVLFVNQNEGRYFIEATRIVEVWDRERLDSSYIIT